MLSISFAPGRLLNQNDGVTPSLINQIMAGAVFTFTGTMDTANITDGAVTWAKAKGGAWHWITSGGTGDILTGTSDTPIAAYTLGLNAAFSAPGTNTVVDPTFNLDSVGAKTIVKPDGTALEIGELISGRIYELRYDTGSGGQWQLTAHAKIVAGQVMAGALGWTQMAVDDWFASSVGGTGDAITVTHENPITAYANGQLIGFVVAAVNTAAVQVNVDAIGLKDVKKAGGETLVANDLQPGAPHLARYSSATGFFELLTPTAAWKDLTASAALDFASTAAQNHTDLTITVTGAALNDPVILGVPNGSVLANSCFTAFVSTTDTVTVRFNNYSAGVLDPALGTFKVIVKKGL